MIARKAEQPRQGNIGGRSVGSQTAGGERETAPPSFIMATGIDVRAESVM
jgi:hypothetical protein